MIPRVLPSALKRGYVEEDVLHAYRHPRLDQITEDNNGNRVRAVIGPGRDGAEFELLVTVDDDERIFHAMKPPRPNFPR